jgi:hypothetical protein
VIVQFLVWIPAAASSFGAFKGMLTGASTVPDFAQLNIGALIACGLVATIVNIWIYARFGQAALRAADPDEPRIGGIAALRYSFALTRGHTLSAIGIAILIGTAAVLGVLLCCIGLLLVGMPLGLSLQAGFYRALRNEPDPQPAAPLPVQRAPLRRGADGVLVPTEGATPTRYCAGNSPRWREGCKKAETVSPPSPSSPPLPPSPSSPRSSSTRQSSHPSPTRTPAPHQSDAPLPPEPSPPEPSPPPPPLPGPPSLSPFSSP